MPLKKLPSAQIDLQEVPSRLTIYPAAQTTLQDPSTHLADVTPSPVAEHLPPRRPQLEESVLVSTQVDPDCVKPALHLTPQDPALQTGVPLVTGEHFLPAPPQLLTSLLVLMHFPDERTNPVAQEAEHVPPLQIGVPFATAGQVRPALPQFSGSLFVLMHRPLEST